MTRTLYDDVLLAAATLPDEFGTPDIVVAAWKVAPARFGLKGYQEVSADSNRVVVTLSGSRGLVHAGLLKRVAPNRYRITNLGLSRIRFLQGGGAAPRLDPTRQDGDPTVRLTLTPEQEAMLQRVFGSEAWSLWMEGRHGDITFPHAVVLWGDGDFGTALQEVRWLLMRGHTGAPREAVLSDRRSVSVKDVAKIDEMDRFLRTRFEKHLKVLAAGKGDSTRDRLGA